MPETQTSEGSATSRRLERTKTSNALKGRTLSEEHKKQVGQGVRNAWKNREYNGYNSRSKHTEETKKKMSEAHKRRWVRIKEALKKVEERGTEN